MGYSGGGEVSNWDYQNNIIYEDHSYCSYGCYDPWIADGFCDQGKIKISPVDWSGA